MKRTLAILAVSSLLAISLTGCGESARRDDMTSSNGNRSAASSTYTYRSTQDGTALEESNTGTPKTTTVYRNTNASANARLRGNSKSVTGTVANPNTDGSRMLGIDEEHDDRAAEMRYQLMLDNARVRDTDGFLFDGENPHHSTAVR